MNELLLEADGEVGSFDVSAFEGVVCGGVSSCIMAGGSSTVR